MSLRTYKESEKELVGSLKMQTYINEIKLFILIYIPALKFLRNSSFRTLSRNDVFWKRNMLVTIITSKKCIDMFLQH